MFQHILFRSNIGDWEGSVQPDMVLWLNIGLGIHKHGRIEVQIAQVTLVEAN